MERPKPPVYNLDNISLSEREAIDNEIMAEQEALDKSSQNPRYSYDAELRKIYAKHNIFPEKVEKSSEAIQREKHLLAKGALGYLKDYRWYVGTIKGSESGVPSLVGKYSKEELDNFKVEAISHRENAKSKLIAALGARALSERGYPDKVESDDDANKIVDQFINEFTGTSKPARSAKGKLETQLKKEIKRK